jgi:hypothetical protein
MNAFTPTMNEVYLEYAERLLRHHQLLSEGLESAEETTQVEDEMTELWDRLDTIQRRSLSGLGSDLNWIRRGGTPAPLGPRAGVLSPEDRRAIDEARDNSDWHRLLHQLRVCVPSIAAIDLADLRAAIWSKLGQPQIARIFHEFSLINLASASGPSGSRPRASTGL